MFGHQSILVLLIVAGHAGALQEIRNFIYALTPEDHQILMSVARDYDKYENLDQLLEAIKAKSAEMYSDNILEVDKVTKLKKLITDNIEKLDDDSKKLVKEFYTKLWSILPAYGANDSLAFNRIATNVYTEIREKYNSLSAESKSRLKEVFPILTNNIIKGYSQIRKESKLRSGKNQSNNGMCPCLL